VENATTLINITEAARDVTVYGLRENSRYHYRVLASNQFGSSSPSTAVEVGKSLQRTHSKILKGQSHYARTHLVSSLPVVTTDVQDVTICRVNTTTYIISCVYLSGSDASGCNYTLMSEEGNIAGSIDRSNSEGKTIVVAGSELLLQAYASDLILDNTTNNLVVTRSITGSSLKQCTLGKGSISTHV
jgi:hypothetical protein